MELKWESNFETGNENVDLQHRFFADLTNGFEIQFRNTDDVAYTAKLIIGLRKYADFHFTSEENIATSLNLSGFNIDHRCHLELLEEFNHHAKDLHKGLMTVSQFLEFLSDWFIGHTIYRDQKLFG